MESYSYDAFYSDLYQYYHQTSPPSPHFPNYAGHGGRIGSYPVVQSGQVQLSTHWQPQAPSRPDGSISADLQSVIPLRAGPPGDPLSPSQFYTSDAQLANALLNPGTSAHFQGHPSTEHGQPIVPSQPHTHVVVQQDPYQVPVMWTPDSSAQHSDPAMSPSSTTISMPPAITSVSSPSPHKCDICGDTFTFRHNLERHSQSKHEMVQHTCGYCGKSYTRSDSLKRHLDRPCAEMPQSTQGGA